jgi:hypothetical protein
VGERPAAARCFASGCRFAVNSSCSDSHVAQTVRSAERVLWDGFW